MSREYVSQSIAECLYRPIGGGGGDTDSEIDVSQSVAEFLYTPSTSPTNPQLQYSQSLAEFLYHVTRVTPSAISVSQSVLEMLYNIPTTPPPPPGDAFYSCGVASSWVPSASAQEARCEGQ
jgi:hypothetical protein